MNKIKLAVASACAFLLFGMAGVAFAITPATYHINVSPDSGPDYVADITAPPLDGSFNLIGFDRTTNAPRIITLGSSWNNSYGDLQVSNVTSGQIQGLDNFYFNNNVSMDYLYSTLASATSSLSSLSSYVFGLPTAVNIATFMGSNGSTTPFIASSTQNGFLSFTDKIKLDSLSAPLAWSGSTSSRSIVTGTGATGFQVSSTRNATVNYNVKVTTTASIAGNADGYVALEIAPTNSATSTDWVEVGRCGNSQALTLAITLQSIQGTTCQLSTDLIAGSYAKLRSVTTTGTVSFAYVSGRETLK